MALLAMHKEITHSAGHQPVQDDRGPPAHFTLSEAQLLEQMKGLAARYQNPTVHVQEFLCMSQQFDEG